METTNTVSAKARGLSKAQFLKTEAPAAVKIAALASLIIFAVIAVLVVSAAITTNSSDLMDLPITTIVIDEYDREDLEDQLKDAADQLKDVDDELDRIEEEYDSRTARVAKNLVKKTRAAAKNLSLENVIGMVDAYEELADREEDLVDELMDTAEEEAEDVMDLGGGLEDMMSLFKTVQMGIFAFAAIVILLALWAALSKSTGLSIFCLILYAPVCALISSTLLAVLVAVAFIALAVTNSRVNKAWKTA